MTDVALQTQLAAAQAENAKLRKAFEFYQTWGPCAEAVDRANEALATPSDDTALKERLNSLKERCANMALDMGGWKIADAIRALEDSK